MKLPTIFRKRECCCRAGPVATRRIAGAAGQGSGAGGVRSPDKTAADDPWLPDAVPAARKRLVFAFDATASRSEAWDAAKGLTDTLLGTLPGQLDVALAVHGGRSFTPSPALPRTQASCATRRRASNVGPALPSCSIFFAGLNSLLGSRCRPLHRRRLRGIRGESREAGGSPRPGRNAGCHSAGWRRRQRARRLRGHCRAHRRRTAAVQYFVAQAGARVDVSRRGARGRRNGIARNKQATMPAATLLLEHLDTKRIGARR